MGWNGWLGLVGWAGWSIWPAIRPSIRSSVRLSQAVSSPIPPLHYQMRPSVRPFCMSIIPPLWTGRGALVALCVLSKMGDGPGFHLLFQTILLSCPNHSQPRPLAPTQPAHPAHPPSCVLSCTLRVT